MDIPSKPDLAERLDLGAARRLFPHAIDAPHLNVAARGPWRRRNHAIDPQAMIAAMDGRTRVLAVVLVSFTPGYRAPMAQLAEACRKRDAMLVVDGVQGCGVLGIDAMATATSKGLFALYGHGFLFVRERWIDRLKPAYLARFSVDQGDAHESETGRLEFKLLSLATHIVTAGRMDGGAYATTDPRLNAAAARLEAAGVRFSIHRGLLRLATHL